MTTTPRRTLFVSTSTGHSRAHGLHRRSVSHKVAIAWARALAVVFSLTSAVTLGAFGLTAANAATASVSLGTATSFAVLAGSTITNTGATVIAGDIGLSPGTSISGFPPGLQSSGVLHTTDAQALSAQT